MRHVWMAAVVVLAGVAAWLGWAMVGRAGETAPGGVKVGVLDPQAAVILYYNSKVHQAYLQELMAERDKAKAAGDEKKVKEIEAKGSASQELAHQQLAGKATSDELVKKLKVDWAAVAKSAGVDVIVSKVEYKREGLELVDVSEAVAEQLGVSEKAKGWIKQQQTRQ